MAEHALGASNVYAVTDADGRYEIVGALAAGPYWIAVQAYDSIYIDQYLGGHRSREDTAPIMVGPQEILEDIDFSLEVGGTITGVVTDAATGRPIPNVSIHAEPQQEGPSADAGTGFGGEYTLSGLAPGRYRIRAWANDQGYASRYFGQTPGQEIEAVLIVGSELLTGIDIVLGRGATVSGRVTDAATGRPIAGIGVRAAPVDGGRHEWAYTESDGTYALRGLPPSSFYVSTANGGERGYVEQFYNGQVEEDQADIVVLASEASVTDVNFALRTGATISGRVIEAATGVSLGNTDIGAEPDGPGYSVWTNADRDGRYTLVGLAPGAYRLIARSEGYVEQLYDRQSIWDRAALVEVGPDTALLNIDFALTTGATISGRVTDAVTGRPIARADVNADSSGEGSNVWTQTAEDGSYFLTGLAAAGYRVLAKSDGYIEQVFDDQTAWDRADLVFVSEDSEHAGIDFALKIGGTITGRVIDQATGRPVANVGVGAENAGDGPSNWTTADRDGRYTLAGIAPGTYRIKASAQEKGYIEVFYPDALNWDDADLVQVSGTEDVAGIDFALRQGATLSGRVTDARTGRPVARLNVGAHSRGGVGGGYSQTLFDGTYTVRGLAPGRYAIKAEGEELGYARQYYGDTPVSERAEVVLVAEDGVDGIDIALKRGATISGKVTDAGTGRGIPEMDINADLSGDWLRYDSTDANGEYTLTGLPEGEIRVAVSGQGYLEQDRTVFVEEGQHIEGFDF